MREADIEEALFDTARKYGGVAIKLYTRTIRFLPDRLVLLPNGVMFFVETKTKKGRFTTGQLRVIQFLRNLGFTVHTNITTPQEAEHLIINNVHRI